MGTKNRGVILLVVVVVLFLVALTSHYLGIGPYPGIGWKKLLGMAVGVVIAAFGMIDLRKAGRGGPA